MAGTARYMSPTTSEIMSQDRVSFRSLWEAWLACRRRKRGTLDCLRYGGRLLDRLAATQAVLEAGTWRPSRARVFVVKRPKAREIHAPLFADRVVHHWLVPQIESLYESTFIFDSFANRKGKGTHAAVARLQSFMRQASCNGQKRAYALQLDIANCFNSIDRRLLFGMVFKRLERGARQFPERAKRYQHLSLITRRLLTGNPADGAFRLGSPANFDRVPPHKRLSNARPECGLAIGNLSSQFFANVYLNELDQFIKHELRCRWYLRYVDDFVLLDPNPQRLIFFREAISKFLGDRLRLELRSPVGEPKSVSCGVDFLGYIVRPYYLLPRRRVVDAAHRCFGLWANRLRTARGIIFRRGQSKALQSSICSYFGHFRHASGRTAAAGLWARHPWLVALFSFAWPNIISRLEAPIATSLAGQHSWMKAHFPGAIVWLEVGSAWECYGPDARKMARQYRLPISGRVRPGMNENVALAKADWPHWQSVFARDGIAAVGAEQYGRVKGHRHGLRRRSLSYLSPVALTQASVGENVVRSSLAVNAPS